VVTTTIIIALAVVALTMAIWQRIAVVVPTVTVGYSTTEPMTTTPAITPTMVIVAIVTQPTTGFIVP